MRSRTALVCMAIALVSRLSFADGAKDSPKVVELKAKLAEVQARVAKELPNAEKAAAAAEKALPGVTTQRQQCEERASATRRVCEDSCEETMRKCRAANYWRSNAQDACEARGNACSTRCVDSATKTCAALNAKEEKVLQTTRLPDPLRRELQEAKADVLEQQEREKREASKRRFVVKWEGDESIESKAGLVLDTKTNLEWLRFHSRGVTQEDATAYCSAKSMRLPTMDEALEISRVEEDIRKRAWPKGLSTWTSTTSNEGRAWRVSASGGLQSLGHVAYDYHYALCVRSVAAE